MTTIIFLSLLYTKGEKPCICAKFKFGEHFSGDFVMVENEMIILNKELIGLGKKISSAFDSGFSKITFSCGCTLVLKPEQLDILEGAIFNQNGVS